MKDNNQLESGRRPHAPVQPPGPFGSTLFVGGVPRSWSERRLEDMFMRHGRVKEVDLKRHRNGESRCFGFVTFFSPQEAMQAFAIMRTRDSSSLRVQFAGSREVVKHEIKQGGKKFQQKKQEERVSVRVENNLDGKKPRASDESKDIPLSSLRESRLSRRMDKVEEIKGGRKEELKNKLFECLMDYAKEDLFNGKENVNSKVKLVRN